MSCGNTNTTQWCSNVLNLKRAVIHSRPYSLVKKVRADMWKPRGSSQNWYVTIGTQSKKRFNTWNSLLNLLGKWKRRVGGLTARLLFFLPDRMGHHLEWEWKWIGKQTKSPAEATWRCGRRSLIIPTFQRELIFRSALFKAVSDNLLDDWHFSYLFKT